MKQVGKLFFSFSKYFLMILGAIFLLMLIISFTDLPYYGIKWLGSYQTDCEDSPEYIIMLGGNGMPSGDNLQRAYYVVTAAKEFPQSKIILSMPGDTTDENSSCILLKNELVIKGVNANRIFIEPEGINTHSQALMLKHFFCENLLERRILLISSTYHMRRALLTFKKAGFNRIISLPSTERDLEVDLNMIPESLIDKELISKTMVGNTTFRYRFWSYLEKEITFMREFTALVYYKLKGWI